MRELVYILARDSPYQLPQDHETDVAIDEPLLRLGQRRQREQPFDGLGRSVGEIADRVIGNQTRLVRQQVANRDRLFSLTGELRQMPAHRIVEPKLAAFNQQHHARRGRQRLGERGQIEDRIDRHRLALRLDAAIAKGPQESDLALSRDEHHAAGHLLGCQRFDDDRFDLGQFGDIHAEFFGRRLRELRRRARVRRKRPSSRLRQSGRAARDATRRTQAGIWKTFCDAPSSVCNAPILVALRPRRHRSDHGELPFRHACRIGDQARRFGTQSASHELLVMEGETYLRLLGAGASVWRMRPAGSPTPTRGSIR